MRDQCGKPCKVFVVGSDGVPVRYGGFETLAEQLSRHQHLHRPIELHVVSSSKGRTSFPKAHHNAAVHYIRLPANGALGLVYDFFGVLMAIRENAETVLFLGVSPALFLPWLRWLRPNTRWICNLDGIEWRREKWGRIARSILKAAECAAVRHATHLVADNEGIARYVNDAYGRAPVHIAYGGDQARLPFKWKPKLAGRPVRVALMVARIEPENNVAMIIRAFAHGAVGGWRLVVVGDWSATPYGRVVKQQFSEAACVEFRAPIFDQEMLTALRLQADLYLHGHSAGGTNPSLVEAMFAGLPVAAFDCSFNRHTTANKALYFTSEWDLRRIAGSYSPSKAAAVAADMKRIADSRYTWSSVCDAYFELFTDGRR